jgi:MoaA/NifB/PqqE/SkfB family radical SAM enzyme
MTMIDQAVRPGHVNHLHPTKRGWLFLGVNGGPCDMACKMCYYTYQKDLIFFSLDTLIGRANKFRHYYGLEYCDISGGEATIYGPKDAQGQRPQLNKLVAHCANIGLKPTIITHGQNNTEALVAGVEDAGLEDWLISLHGMRTGHDRTVINHKGEGEGGWDRLIANLRHVQRPVRFNTTVQNFNYHELPDLARWLRDERRATVWNLINFNPFYAWADKPVIEFQASLSELAPHIAEAIHIAESAGWEVNVRYFPFCVAAEHGFARNCVTFYGTQYDHWEWGLEATNGLYMSTVEKHFGDVETARRRQCDSIGGERANSVCACCRFNHICESVPKQYQERYGLGELKAVAGQPVLDEAYFEKGGAFA